MSGICSAFPEALVAVGVMIRVEMPCGVTMKVFWAGVLVAAPPQPPDTKSRGMKISSAAMA